MFIKQLQIKNFKCFKDKTFKSLAVPNGEKENLKTGVSLQEYIRHSIHHPENTENDKYSDEELRKSTQEMIDFIK